MQQKIINTVEILAEIIGNSYFFSIFLLYYTILVYF